MHSGSVKYDETLVNILTCIVACADFRTSPQLPLFQSSVFASKEILFYKVKSQYILLYFPTRYSVTKFSWVFFKKQVMS